jgi:hypothetical protein
VVYVGAEVPPLVSASAVAEDAVLLVSETAGLSVEESVLSPEHPAINEAVKAMHITIPSSSRKMLFFMTYHPFMRVKFLLKIECI